MSVEKMSLRLPSTVVLVDLDLALREEEYALVGEPPARLTKVRLSLRLSAWETEPPLTAEEIARIGRVVALLLTPGTPEEGE